MWDYTHPSYEQSVDSANNIPYRPFDFSDLPVDMRLHDTCRVAQSLQHYIDKNTTKPDEKSFNYNHFPSFRIHHLRGILDRVHDHIEKLQWCKQVITGNIFIDRQTAWCAVNDILNAPDPVLDVDCLLTESPDWHLQFFQSFDQATFEKSSRQIARLRDICGVED